MALSPLAVRLLSVCCIEPQTQVEVEAVLWRRGFPLALTEEALGRQLGVLVEAGYLSGYGGRYALTVAGEDLLDQHWGAA